ncbi:hypothetical protein D3C81_1969050 [compost metagenome]
MMGIDWMLLTRVLTRKLQKSAIAISSGLTAPLKLPAPHSLHGAICYPFSVALSFANGLL